MLEAERPQHAGHFAGSAGPFRAEFWLKTTFWAGLVRPGRLNDRVNGHVRQRTPWGCQREGGTSPCRPAHWLVRTSTPGSEPRNSRRKQRVFGQSRSTGKPGPGPAAFDGSRRPVAEALAMQAFPVYPPVGQLAPHHRQLENFKEAVFVNS